MSGHAGGGSGFSGSEISALDSLVFGSAQDSAGTTSGSTIKSGISTEQLVVDEEGLLKLITDALGGEQGLADIFGGEQASGIFNSSVAKQEAGNLLAKVAGELAKLTGTKVSEFKSEEDLSKTTESSQKSPNAIDKIKNLFGF